MKLFLVVLIIALLVGGCQPVTVCSTLTNGGYVAQTTPYLVNVYAKNGTQMFTDIPVEWIARECGK